MGNGELAYEILNGINVLGSLSSMLPSSSDDSYADAILLAAYCIFLHREKLVSRSRYILLFRQDKPW